MPQPNEREFLHYVLKDNAPAILFCESLFRVSQTLDDLIDRDKPVTNDAIYQAFWEALIDIPTNSFYRAYELTLRPLMAAALQDWKDSVTLERDDSHHNKTIAFVLRDQLTSLVVQCACLVGGFVWMQQVSKDIRLQFHSETLGEYINELGAGVSP